MTMAKVSQSHIKAWRITLPSLGEQRSVIEHVEHINTYMSTLLMYSQMMIDSLIERRTALISAAVTGKIDVRDWTPPEASANGETP